MSDPLKTLSLYMVLLGSKARNRNVEQHDFFFGIGADLKDLVPAMKAFWPEAGNSIHIDGWRRITRVDGFEIRIGERSNDGNPPAGKKLFFINLGGYMSGRLEEQHYTVLSVHEDRMQAIQHAKKTVFFKTNTLKGIAGSHIDEKYGIDVDDIYRVEDILGAELKQQYQIEIVPGADQLEDEINLGYLQLHKIK